MFIFRNFNLLASKYRRQWWRKNLENIFQTLLTTVNNTHCLQLVPTIERPS